MKAITMFETEDGRKFDSESKAKRHERYSKAIKEVRSILLPGNFKDKGCDFANGGGYFQLTKTQVDAFFVGFRNLIETFEPGLLEVYDKNPKGWIGRYLCDGDSPAYALYSLAIQIDSSNRLWGQPYFATHPWEGKQVCLNRE